LPFDSRGRNSIDPFMRRVLDTDRGGGLYAKRQAPRHDRAGLRRHEVQPPLRPLPTPRQIRRPLGMAADHRHTQPAETLAAHPDPDARLSRRPGPAADDSAETLELTPTARQDRSPTFATASAQSASGGRAWETADTSRRAEAPSSPLPVVVGCDSVRRHGLRRRRFASENERRRGDSPGALRLLDARAKDGAA